MPDGGGMVDPMKDMRRRRALAGLLVRHRSIAARRKRERQNRKAGRGARR